MLAPSFPALLQHHSCMMTYANYKGLASQRMIPSQDETITVKPSSIALPVPMMECSAEHATCQKLLTVTTTR